MELNGKRVVIFVDTMYQEMELWYPLYRLREAGAEVVIAAAKAGQTYTSKLGYPCTSQVSYDELRAADFDGLIIPGGYAPDHMRRHAGASWEDAEVVVDGNLVTSRKPDDLPAFCRASIEVLANAPVAA